MRKFLWGCLIASVVSVMGFSGVAEYAWRKPDSRVGQWCAILHTLGENQIVVTRLSVKAARATVQQVAGVVGPERVGVETASWDRPKGYAETPPLPDEYPALPTPGATELPPARLPGQIVIEDATMPIIDSIKTEAIPPVRDFVGVMPLPGQIEESQVETTRMPRVDDVPVAMPAVEEWEKIGPPSICPSDKVWEPTLTGHEQSGYLPACPRETHASDKTPDCVCPGKGPTSSQPSGAVEESEVEPLEKLKVMPKTLPSSSNKGKHPNVDTMDFRPTDLGFPWNDLRGPF